MTLRLRLIVLGLTGCLSTMTMAADDKVEVLARGPVHEAYAEPSEREPAPTPVIAKEPPKPIEELPPDQKPEGENVQWMSGYWQWDQDRKDFIWVSGFWRNSPPGRAWVPGSWRQVEGGWQWTGGFWHQAGDDGKAQVEYLPKPPAPLDAEGPTTPAPTENHVYSPGSWVYRDRYVWRPGYWYEHRPDLIWCPAHYRWSPAGYVFIDGYWDYPLVERGVLFAPVYVPPVVYSAPAYVYTPSYVVREDCLFGAFFCRRGFGSYYFGDYFAPSYASIGFSAWCGNVGLSFSFGQAWHDPLFSYYRCGFRSDPFWRTGVFDLYAGRYRGDYLRPPVTLVQQNTVINNITNVTNINNVNTNNVTMLTSLNNAGRGGQRKLTRVPESERREFQAAAGSNRDLAVRRAQGEAKLAARPGGAGGKTGAPAALTLNTPPAPKGATRPKGIEPKTGGLSQRPTVNRPVAPPPPKPSPLGKLEPKGAMTGPGTGGTGLPATRPNLKPPVAPRAGLGSPKGELRPRPIEPKGSGLNPLPKGPGSNVIPKANVPGAKPRPSIPPRPAPKTTLPPPKLSQPLSRPQSFKPAPTAPPVTIPKPTPRPAMAPRTVPSVPRSFSPPSAPARSLQPGIGSGAPRLGPPASAPRIAPPSISRPAPSRPAPSRPAPSRPAPPRKGKG